LLLDPALGPSRRAALRAGDPAAPQRAPGLRGVGGGDIRRGPQAVHPVPVRPGPGVRRAVPGGLLPAVLAGADLPADRPGDTGGAVVRVAGGEDTAGDHGFLRRYGFLRR